MSEKSLAGKLIVFMDFDGTISQRDIGDAMLEEFCRGDWRRHVEDWEKKILSTFECANLVLQNLEADENQMEAFFRLQEIDPAFHDFAAWLNDQGIPALVLSDGFDNYISVVFKRFDINLPYYSNHLTYEGSWGIECPFLNDECAICGVCKLSLIGALKPPGAVTVYIGDGYSDTCPAPACDIIFAKGSLAAYLAEKGTIYHEYRDFNDVRLIMNALLKSFREYG